MNKQNSALDVLRLFATYGFRKASMSDIARAADLSRQSIYNQHGSKEAVLDWAVTTFLDDVTNSVIEGLRSATGDTSDVLARSFQAWTGDYVPLLRGTPHGAEILETALSSVANAARDYEGEFAGALAAFILKRGVCPTETAAEDVAYVLGIASKGLLLKSETSEAYAAGMSRVIAVIVERQP